MRYKNLLIIGLFSPLFANTEIAEQYFRLAIEAEKKNEHEKADLYFRKSAQLDPKNIALHSYLGTYYALRNDFVSALEHYIIALPHKPDDASLYYNTGHCLREIGLAKESIGYFDRVLTLTADHESAHQGRGLALLTIGKYQEAWPDYEYRLQPPSKTARQFTQFMQNDGNLKGKRVVLRATFGLGDTFQFIRFAQMLKEAGAYVIVEAQKPTIDILKLCPYLDVVKSDDGITPTHDHFTLLMSLPWALNISLDSLPNKPYLYASKRLESVWKQKLSRDKNFKIGICWNSFYSQKRAVPLELFKPLAQIHGISLYSLQKETGIDQLKNLSEDFKIHTFDNSFDEIHGRFMDTAAVIKNLDLVITVDTSIAHLAGALGAPVWLMILHVADWRWLQERTDSPWYPTMRIFRQPESDDWKSVIDEVCKELEILVKK